MEHDAEQLVKQIAERLTNAIIEALSQMTIPQFVGLFAIQKGEET